MVVSIFLLFSAHVYSQASWPDTWIQVDWDKNENGPVDDWRDVEFAYYQYDGSYLYFKLECYDTPGKEWAIAPDGDGRYKWFIDFEGNLYHSGENIFDAEYLLFVEDTDEDGNGEMYLLHETNGDNNFGEYEPWPPTNYANFAVTNTTIGGWRIVSPYQIEMYISWASIGNPSSFWITWATDQENPNLDQGPTTDHMDEEQPVQGVVKHYLTVISPYDTPGGEGWYANCTNAYATLDTGIVDHGNGTRRVFTHWSGDASGTNFTSSDPIHMDQNKTAIANWKKQYNLALVTNPPSITTPTGQGWYDAGTYAFISTPEFVDITPGASRYRFNGWTTADMNEITNASSLSTTVLMDKPKTVTANYVIQYYVIFSQSGVGTDFSGTVVTIDGTGYGVGDLPVSFWYDTGSSHSFSFASPLVVNSSKQYVWLSTSGLSTLQTDTLTITNSGSAVGNYGAQVKYQITFDQTGVGSDFNGAIVIIDGAPYNRTDLFVSFLWDAGSSHNFAFQSPLMVTANAKRYVWNSTSGLSSLQSDSITVSTSGSIIGNYKTQYYLTVISPYDTPGGEDWYYSSTDAYATLLTGTVDHGNGTRRLFTNWSGDASGTTLTSDPIHMDGPKTAIANWKTQYYLTVTSPYNTPTPTSGWFDAGTPITASVTSPWPGATGIQYICTGWTGTGSTPASGSTTSVGFTINEPSTITWTWKTQYYLAVSSAHGTTGGEGWYDEGETAYATVTPLTVPGPTGVQYVFTQWSGDASGNTSPSNPMTMDDPKTAVANWKTQYYLTVRTDPTGLSPAPTPSSGWHDESTNVQLTASDPSFKGSVEYSFKYWIVDGVPQGTGVKQITVPMNGPHTATAHYEPAAPPPPPPVGGHIAPIRIAGEPPSPPLPTGLIPTLLASAAIMTIIIRSKGKKSVRAPKPH